jgi:rhodanese-related sulfurtransferase
VKHSPGFLALVNDAKKRVKTMTIAEYNQALMKKDHHILIDVREDHEWVNGRLPGAMHISKGVIERDIESHFDLGTPIVCYCGGGFRSILVCDNLQKMGYTNVTSLDGGYRGWVAANLPIETDETE